ncbi:hypothetical protein PV355_10005 [Streptomyces stelliscabiei]|uniref:hypothetical protein n=1 Tax=Streptomyces stelliscabiei TaxID=146820 RepID=UPI0029BD41E4|nr:hypothetical protein [Streptomyces stelliscabiei]MDX2515473.1 hypothetical protein [Streptomyces stelliscabiei]
MNSRPLETVLSEYELASHARRSLFEGFNATRLDELEDATGDSNAASAAVAVRLAALATWQTQLRELEDAACGWPALRPFLDGQHAERRAAYERTTSAFTTWYFHGWATLPDTDTGEMTR